MIMLVPCKFPLFSSSTEDSKYILKISEIGLSAVDNNTLAKIAQTALSSEQKKAFMIRQ